MGTQRIVVTGATGFVGRYLLAKTQDRFKIHGIGRRSPERCGAPVHANITWHQVDIADAKPLSAVFRQIEEEGGADVLVHLAVYYDFTGREHPEYRRTNVDGLRLVLEHSQRLNLQRFIFASSVAACDYPPSGRTVNELSPPDAPHVYARMKREGEEMLREYAGSVPSCIVRMAALFSDWCEYPPLYVFLRTWLSGAWNSRLLAGKGNSAVPYLHVLDAVSALVKLIENPDMPVPAEVFVASTDGSVSHRELFEAATSACTGRREEPLLLPRMLCGPGVWAREALKGMLGERPFERAWMCRHIDRQLNVDGARTRHRLGWQPRRRLEILRRMPFLMENFKSHPLDWHRLNHAAMKKARPHPNLVVHRLLGEHREEIEKAFNERMLSPDGRKRSFVDYQRLSGEDRRWFLRLLLQNLMSAVRTREKGVFREYCRELAERRVREGFACQEVCEALRSIGRIAVRILSQAAAAEGMEPDLQDLITMTVEFGVDQVQEVYEERGS